MPALPTLTAESSSEGANDAIITSQPIVTVVPPIQFPSGTKKGFEIGCLVLLFSLAVFL